MTTTRPIPTSQNDAWGFTGTMDRAIASNGAKPEEGFAVGIR